VLHGLQIAQGCRINRDIALRGGARGTQVHAEARALPGHVSHAAAVQPVIVEPGFADRHDARTARTLEEVGRTATHGQPVFAVARPDGRQVWVNFAFPHNGVVQVIDVPTLAVVKQLQPGRAVLHLEFTPRGEQVWISSRDDNVVVVYDTASYAERVRIAAERPSGIFLTARALRTGF